MNAVVLKNRTQNALGPFYVYTGLVIVMVTLYPIFTMMSRSDYIYTYPSKAPLYS